MGDKRTDTSVRENSRNTDKRKRKGIRKEKGTRGDSRMERKRTERERR